VLVRYPDKELDVKLGSRWNERRYTTPVGQNELDEDAVPQWREDR